MSNGRPPGYRGPGKNTPPAKNGFPGGQRPPINRGLNAWSGPTWAETVRPSNSVPRLQPPKSSQFPKTPPKPPGFKPPITPRAFGLGLGAVGVNLALNLVLGSIPSSKPRK